MIARAKGNITVLSHLKGDCLIGVGEWVVGTRSWVVHGSWVVVRGPWVVGRGPEIPNVYTSCIHTFMLFQMPSRKSGFVRDLFHVRIKRTLYF